MNNLKRKPRQLTLFSLLVTLIVVTVSCKNDQKENTESHQENVENAPATIIPIPLLIAHFPLHAGNNKPIKFSIKASGNKKIINVLLNLNEYNLFLNSDGTRGQSRRDGGIWGELKAWQLDTPKKSIDLNFTYSKGFPEKTLIRYEFVIKYADGSTAKRTVTSQVGNSPFGTKEVLIYSTSNEGYRNTIDICFVPHRADYQSNIKKFLTDLETTIYKGYLTNNMITNNSEEWSFYYTPDLCDAKVRKRSSLPPSVSSSPIIDIFSMIHNVKFRDARNGNIFSSEYYNVGTVVHESGHAVFNLSDEYSPSYIISNACNIYKTSSACSTANANSGFPSGDCRSISNHEGKVYYTPESKALACIMKSDQDRKMPDFARSCQKCIINYYTRLNRIKNYLPIEENNKEFAIMQTEKVIIVKIAIKNEKWDADIVRVDYGAPSLNINNHNDINLSFTNKNNLEVYSISIDDPRVYHMHEDENEKIFKQTNDTGERYIVIPYNMELKNLKIKVDSEEFKKQEILIDISNGIRKLK